MHHIIRMIVYAKTKKDARKKAEEIFNENLCPTPFDYGTFFDEDDNMNGTSRWGKIPPVELANSKEGKTLIDEGFKVVKAEFEETINNMRRLFKEYNNKELFEGKALDKNKQILAELEENKNMGVDSPFWFKHNCWKLGKGDWLYNHSEAIQNSKELKDTLSMKYNTDKEDKVWVIPIDVHT